VRNGAPFIAHRLKKLPEYRRGEAAVVEDIGSGFDFYCDFYKVLDAPVDEY